MTMTPDDYVVGEACACPVCGGEVCNMPSECAVLGSAVNGTPGLLLKARCVDCQSTWTETFKLTGYTDLEPSEQGVLEIVPTNLGNMILEHLEEREHPHPSTAKEWLSEIEYHLDGSIRALQCNEILARDVESQMQFITECLTAIAFLRQAGVNTTEENTSAFQD